ncbi:MAG: hypothetical protein J6X20_03730 [Bacteroidales bacterium]|nr:hypothetical protein [Bacteroidales bacterium]
MAGIGSDQRKQQQQNEQQDSGKFCLVQFRPIPEWKGEYGFDWFRMMGDYDDKREENENADNFDSNIGKYMCASPSVKIYCNWDGKENGIEAEAINPNFTEDINQTPCCFCQYYILRNGIKIPVVKDGTSYKALHYDVDESLKTKTVTFKRYVNGIWRKVVITYENTTLRKITLITSEEVYILNPGKAPKKQWEWTAGESFTQKSEINEDVRKKYVLTRDMVNAFWDRIGLLDEKKLAAPAQIRGLDNTYNEGTVEYTTKKIVSADLNGQRFTFSYYNGKLEKLKVYEFRKEIEKMHFDMTLDKYDRAKDEKDKKEYLSILSKKFRPYYLLGVNQKTGKWESAKARQWGDGWFDSEIKNEKLQAERYASEYYGYSVIKDQNKKHKWGIYEDFLENKDINANELLNSPILNKRAAGFFIEMTPAGKIVEEPLTVTEAGEKKLPTYGIYEDKVMKVDKPCDDGILHLYCEDYLVNRRIRVYDSGRGKYMGYPIPVLGMAQFGSKNERKRFFTTIYDEADVQMLYHGDFDKITFTPTSENIKVDPEKVTSPKKDRLNIRVTGQCNTTEYIVAQNEKGIRVGLLELRVWPPIPVDILLISVITDVCSGVDDSEDAYNASLQEGWSPEKDRHYQLLSQAGIILKEKKISLPVPRSALVPFLDEHGNFCRDSVDGDDLILSDMLDEQLRKGLKGTEKFIRIYIVNKRFDDNGKRPLGFSFCGSPVIVIFKKTIDERNYDMKETLAHELMHQLNLDHSFHNASPFTFKFRTTTNVMDYSGRSYSLGLAQWEVIRAKAQAIWNEKY